jgi:hypothetical protein
VSVRFCDELGFAFGWIAPEPAFMQRCSHAVAAGGRVWVIDPVAGEGVLERIRELGDPGGVVQLLDVHARDSAVVAEHLGVPHHRLPFAGVAGAPFEVVPVRRIRFWREVALWFPEHRTLVCGDALGTAQYFRAPDERLAVHPILRLWPPRALGRFEPDHVLVGHGEGIHTEATAALRGALSGGRRRIPSWLAAGIRAHGPWAARRRRRY